MLVDKNHEKHMQQKLWENKNYFKLELYNLFIGHNKLKNMNKNPSTN